MARRFHTLAGYFAQTGRTQESLALKVGVTPHYISMIAAGMRTPKLPLAIKISDYTGVPLHSLIRDEAAA